MQQYKVKLESGRVLGPLDLERIRLLILKNQILGRELARLYPVGDWVKIGAIHEIGDLLIARAEGKLNKDSAPLSGADMPVNDGATYILPENRTQRSSALPGAEESFDSDSALTSDDIATQMVEPQYDDASTRVVPPKTSAPNKKRRTKVPARPEGNATDHFSPDSALENEVVSGGEHITIGAEHGSEKEDVNAYVSGSLDDDSDEEKTQMNVNLLDEAGRLREYSNSRLEQYPDVMAGRGMDVDPRDIEEMRNGPQEQRANLSQEPTVMLYGNIARKNKKAAPKKLEGKEKIKAILAAIALGIAGYQVFLQEPETPAQNNRPQTIRPTLPIQTAKPDPNESQKFYNSAMHDYVQDTVVGYELAATKLEKASAEDLNNVKALAMLASTYLNLIDSSNKDENYFSVISKLIDMTRAKSVDLSETVIGDVEFFVTVNKPEAAQNRIVEYTKTHPKFGLEMFYYLSLAFYARGDYQSASRYVQQIPDNKAFSPKVFYLRGLIAEKLGDEDTAIQQYEHALQMNKSHAKSHLRIAFIKNERGRILDAEGNLDFITRNTRLLSPKDLALAYYLHSLLNEQKKNYAVALGDAERSVQLDKDDHTYLLQLYSMRAKGGESMAKLRNEAKMYYYLEEGESLLKKGKSQDALSQFLQARQSNSSSPIPLVKIGDMFRYLHDLANARINYKMAAERAPNNIEIWTKYIDVLIQSYEWDEAQVAMEKFRKLPVSQSAIDKAAGDMYAKQGQFQEAQQFYKKAMARETIDPTVYTAYAKALMATQNYREAPFFFALAQRYDPLNVEAIIGTAKCVANTDSLDRGVALLQDELQKGSVYRAELLGAIADFQIQKGDWSQAQQTVNQAMSADPDYAYPWKLQAEIYMNQEGHDKKALDKALQAYQSYSDRNSSDPSGYLERYQIFIRKSQFDQAADELGKIYGIYPKYPNLHFYKGALYGIQGNHKLAIEEYRTELANSPNNVRTLLALGKEYIELGGYNDALGLFNKAMQIEPNSGEPKHLSGYANYLLKNYTGAIALYNSAIQRDPGNPLVYKRLGLAYRDVGDGASAAASFQKYLQMEPDAPDRNEFARYAQ